MIALLAFAMGGRNAIVRKIAVPDLTTTVLTMTLTGLASEAFRGAGWTKIRLAGSSRSPRCWWAPCAARCSCGSIYGWC